MWQFCNRFFLACFTGVFLFFLATSICFAADTPFTTNLQTTYTVGSTGSTQITHQFTITNKTPTTFLKEYGITLHSTNVTDIVAKNNDQLLTPSITTKNNTTTIGITFPDEIVGEGKTRSFSISYKTNDIASMAGKVLEVQIPPLSSDGTYDVYSVILKTPLQYGKAVRITPAPNATDIKDQFIVTTFTDPGKKPISAFFGEEQFYKITLRYNLQNTGTSTGIAQVALPPDTPYQKINVFSIDPQPSDLKVDEDGNWLATYTLAPQSTTEVMVSEAVRLTLDPDAAVIETPPLPDDLKAQKYWEVNSNPIQGLVQENNTVEKIYEYVVKTLSYSYSVAEKSVVNRRLGAIEALDNPTEAVCQEFTDTFIALARAAHIPARRLTGYAYTQNDTLRPLSLEGDILHAWPEFFDTTQNRWHQVDPTWEDTTGGVDYFHNFDLSHIVFAINGSSSTTPYPVGSYKGDNINSKDVDVSFTDTFPEVTPKVSVEIQPVKLATLNLPGLYTILITNTTGQAWYDMTITVDSLNATVTPGFTEKKLATLLPFQTVSIPLELMTPTWSLPKTAAVTTKFVLAGHGTMYETKEELTASTPLITKIKTPNLIVGLGSGSIIALLAAGSLLVFRRKR